MKKATCLICLMLAIVLAGGLLSGCGGGSGGGNTEKTYIIYSDTSFPPFEYMDMDSKTYVGIDMDLLAAIAEDQGFKYELKNEGFDPAMAAVQSGQADAMIAGMSITDDRRESYDFSEGYFEDGQIMVVSKDSSIASLSDLSGTVVACKIGTMGTEYAEENKDAYGFTTQNYEDSPTMYAAVMNGTNAACFEDYSVVEWAIKSEDLPLKTVGEVINPKYYGFAVKKGENAELIQMFNDGLANIRESGEYDAIIAKYSS